MLALADTNRAGARTEPRDPMVRSSYFVDESVVSGGTHASASELLAAATNDSDFTSADIPGWLGSVGAIEPPWAAGLLRKSGVPSPGALLPGPCQQITLARLHLESLEVLLIGLFAMCTGCSQQMQDALLDLAIMVGRLAARARRHERLWCNYADPRAPP